ncbi:oxidoreductase family protein [Rhizobium sullae]|uniref:Oxidoreductase family protein n=2 Tax=Rhizobium sullae TaxID=50338 RepID=A0A4R3PVB4_RHISU|nr:oxidoreductase family protein [Rhizobium sullae]
MTDLAVFGAGRIGHVHALNAASLPSVRVKYLVDPVASEQRAGLAVRIGADIVSADTVFSDASVDGIVIASSTDTHAGLLLQAARAGKAIFCEKPVSLDFVTVEAVTTAVETFRRAIGDNRRREYRSTAILVRQAVVAPQLHLQDSK